MRLAGKEFLEMRSKAERQKARPKRKSIAERVRQFNQMLDAVVLQALEDQGIIKKVARRPRFG